MPAANSIFSALDCGAIAAIAATSCENTLQCHKNATSFLISDDQVPVQITFQPVSMIEDSNKDAFSIECIADYAICSHKCINKFRHNPHLLKACSMAVSRYFFGGTPISELSDGSAAGFLSETYYQAKSKSCFHGDEMVEIRSDNTNQTFLIRVRDVETGQMIRTGRNSFEPVLGWLHAIPDVATTFIDIDYFDSNGEEKTLRITTEHLIFVLTGAETSGRRQITSRKACDIRPGDSIISTTGNGMWEISTVISTIEGLHTGIYAPLTSSGCVVVSGVLASCYANISTHSLGHFVSSLLRAVLWTYYCCYRCESQLDDESHLPLEDFELVEGVTRSPEATRNAELVLQKWIDKELKRISSFIKKEYVSSDERQRGKIQIAKYVKA